MDKIESWKLMEVFIVLLVSVVIIPLTVGYFYGKSNVDPNTPEGVAYYKEMN